MDRVEAMHKYCIAEEGNIGVIVAAVGLIGVLIASEIKKAMDDAAKRKNESKTGSTSNQSNDKKRLKWSANGHTYEEWLTAERKFCEKYNGPLRELFNGCNEAIIADIKRLQQKPAFKNLPVMYHPTPFDENIRMWRLDTINDAKYLNYTYDSIWLGLAAEPSFFDEYIEEMTEDGKIKWDADAAANPDERKAIEAHDAKIIKQYLIAIDRIIQKHANTFMTKLRQLGFPSCTLESEHMTEEYLFEERIISFDHSVLWSIPLD